ELVGGERLAVELDGGQGATGLVTVIQAAAVGQATMAELAEGVIFVAQGGPALVLLEQVDQALNGCWTFKELGRIK
ncbi:hypothetical protein, partial [Pseudomonas indica]|uniref:hypothetical protein n=1 Tax=Pseudomonas indica TaxID=137658 RepID=UPI000BC9DB33